MKRNDVLSWDQYFMAMAHLSAKRSKDPNTQVGACIVNAQKRVVGLGYNGFPKGCDDDEFPWERKADNEEDTKYPYVVHAELNAILNFRGDIRAMSGATAYVTLFPCHECAKAIIQSGIKHIIYLDNKYEGTVDNREAIKMFKAAGISVTQYIPKVRIIVCDD